MNRQINDDTEYVLQAAFSCISFGYSWEPDHIWEDCLAVYGLTCEIFSSENHSKNAFMSFAALKNFPEWYVKDSELLLIKPGTKAVSVTEKCREVLQKGQVLLSNKKHLTDKPMEGCGLVIYDNWCEELRRETVQGVTDIACMVPHIFIHYEGKLRIRQFLELCRCLIPNSDKSALTIAISKYEEIVDICEKCIREMLPQMPANAEEAGLQRQSYIGLLKRCRELEEEALNALANKNL